MSKRISWGELALLIPLGLLWLWMLWVFFGPRIRELFSDPRMLMP